MTRCSRGAIALLTVLSFVCFCSLSSKAQWTTSSNNIYNSNTGFVGVGTNAPQAQLHVWGGVVGQTQGNTLEIARIEGNSGNGSQLRFLLNRFSSGNSWLGVSTRFQAFTDVTPQGYMEFNPNGSTYAIAFGSGNTEAMRILNTGFVGVGTTTPQATFESTGPALGQAANNTSEMARFSAGIGDYGQLRFVMNRFAAGNGWLGVSTRMQAWTDATAQGYMEFNPNGSTYGIAFGSGGSEIMRMLSSGNVLIGKTSQANSGYMLDVNGNGRFNEVVVNANGADYVFDSGYKLSSLAQLDAYIRKEHHLPGIAPAAQMQREGLNLGDNQTQLLAKIEELTLYLIEQDKEIKTLKKEKEDLLDIKQRLAALEEKSISK